MRWRPAVAVCLVAALGLGVAYGSPCGVLYECHDHTDSSTSPYDLRVDEVDDWTTTDHGGTIAVRFRGVLRNTAVTAALERPDGELLDEAELGPLAGNGTAYTSTVWLDPGGLVEGRYVVRVTTPVRERPLYERHRRFDGPDAAIEVTTSADSYPVAFVERCDNVLGRTVDVRVDVRNTGDVDQRFDIVVAFDGGTHTGRVYLGPGESRRLSREFDQLPYREEGGERVEGGTYNASVQVAAGNRTVANRTVPVTLPTLNDDRECRESPR